MPLAIVGFDPALILFVGSVNMSYQFFIHTERVNKLPAAIEFLFNTPSHHRVHHATNERYIDRNFGGILILWDRIFGTFQAEVQEDRPRYGIVGGVEPANVLWLSWHEWFAIMRDFKLAPAGAKLRSLFGSPAAAKIAMADVNLSTP
jgi:sterol desaturase/sphingolipid hydroxylase (fatty acid hydroxylase superfamily)